MWTTILTFKAQEMKTAEFANSNYYTASVILWIKSGHKNRMTIHVITLWCLHVTSLTTIMSVMHFLID